MSIRAKLQNENVQIRISRGTALVRTRKTGEIQEFSTKNLHVDRAGLHDSCDLYFAGMCFKNLTVDPSMKW